MNNEYFNDTVNGIWIFAEVIVVTAICSQFAWTGVTNSFSEDGLWRGLMWSSLIIVPSEILRLARAAYNELQQLEIHQLEEIQIERHLGLPSLAMPSYSSFVLEESPPIFPLRQEIGNTDKAGHVSEMFGSQKAENTDEVARVLGEMPNDFSLPHGKTVFVDFAKATQATSEELVQLIEKNKNIVKTPNFDLKDIAKLSKNSKEQLQACDTIILVYDKFVPIQWFINRLLGYYHLSAYRSIPPQIFIYTGDVEVGRLPVSIISSILNRESSGIFSKDNLSNNPTLNQLRLSTTG